MPSPADKLVSSTLPLVHRHVNKLVPDYPNKDVFISAGTQGLKEAAECFILKGHDDKETDEDGKPVNFGTYATFWVRQSIKKAIKKAIKK